MFQTLYEAAITKEADIVACGVVQEYADKQNMLVPNTKNIKKALIF